MQVFNITVDLAKFWSRVDIPQKRGWRDLCWTWRGAITTDRPATAEGGWGGGYGCLQVNGKWWRAHRYLYSMLSGQGLGPEEIIMHTCDNRSCVNPRHLVLGTHSENLQHQYERGRR